MQNEPIHSLYDEEDSFRDHIATVDEKGKRKWIFPKMTKGAYTQARKYLAWVLIAILFIGPFLRYDGQPFILFNILERHFILFGIVFMPQDFHLFVLAMITFVLFIVLFTVIWGRLFCGWICPQTIFMEMVFRKIEYWIEGDGPQQRKLSSAPWNMEKTTKRTIKYTLFYLISFLIGNTFLAYIIGSDAVLKIIQEPVLDANSIVVAYDHVRGEPRTKLAREVKIGGDCIDCKQCLYVCPTGIDIRNGTQLECTNCTACIDACDDIMVKINRPTGLIRYDSHNGILSGSKILWTNRVKAYSLLLILLLSVLGFLLGTRGDVELTVMRTPGMLFQENPDGQISNLYNFQLANKTNKPIQIKMITKTEGATIKIIGALNLLPASEVSKGSFFIYLPKDKLEDRKTEVNLTIMQGQKVLTSTSTNFMGPITFK